MSLSNDKFSLTRHDGADRVEYSITSNQNGATQYIGTVELTTMDRRHSYNDLVVLLTLVNQDDSILS